MDSATKGGAIASTKTIAGELARDGITVKCGYSAAYMTGQTLSVSGGPTMSGPPR